MPRLWQAQYDRSQLIPSLHRWLFSPLLSGCVLYGRAQGRCDSEHKACQCQRHPDPVKRNPHLDRADHLLRGVLALK